VRGPKSVRIGSNGVKTASNQNAVFKWTILNYLNFTYLLFAKGLESVRTESVGQNAA